MSNKYKKLEERIKLLELKINHPPLYKKGDKVIYHDDGKEYTILSHFYNVDIYKVLYKIIDSDFNIINNCYEKQLKLVKNNNKELICIFCNGTGNLEKRKDYLKESE